MAAASDIYRSNLSCFVSITVCKLSKKIKVDDKYMTARTLETYERIEKRKFLNRDIVEQVYVQSALHENLKVES